MNAQPKPYLTPEEYGEIELAAEMKSEYLDGEMYAMSGGSPAHNVISANLIRELGNQLKKRPCRVFTSDQRVKVDASGLYTYPDVTVVCGDLRFDPQVKHTLSNPILIIEVLSPSTEAWDRGDKARMYRQLETLQEYLLVSQDKAQIDHYIRQGDGSWRVRDVDGMTGVVDLRSIDCRIELSEIYDKVDFTPVFAAAAEEPGPEH